jgi:hypothetical protein
VAQDATWQAPAQNWRREIGAVSDIRKNLRGVGSVGVGNIGAIRVSRGFSRIGNAMSSR